MSVCGALVARGIGVGVRGAVEQPAATSTAITIATRGPRITALRSGMLAQFEAADLATVHLVRPVGEAERPRVRPHEGKWELLADAAAAVHLHRPVDDLARHVRNRDLDLRDRLLGRLVA